MRALESIKATKQEGKWRIEVHEVEGRILTAIVDGPWKEVSKVLTALDEGYEGAWEVFEK